MRFIDKFIVFIAFQRCDRGNSGDIYFSLEFFPMTVKPTPNFRLNLFNLDLQENLADFTIT